MTPLGRFFVFGWRISVRIDAGLTEDLGKAKSPGWNPGLLQLR
jgi:hypothetical protein